MKTLLLYLCIINALSLLLMRIDKRKSQKSRWRIRERTLLSVATLGGSLGATIGMYLFRHKTRHKRFAIGLPALLVLHILLFALYLYFFEFSA